MKTYIILAAPTMILAQSPDLMGEDFQIDKSDTSSSTFDQDAPPSNAILQLGRNIANTRNMVHELAEESDNPINVFTLDVTMSDGKVYPRFLIRRHGCWCNYEGCDGEKGCEQGVAPRVNNYWGMPHVTQLDKNCHKMFNAHKCLTQELPGCKNMRQKYKYRFHSEGNGSIECLANKNDECQQALCLIDKNFAEELVEMAREDPDEVKSWTDKYWFESDEDFESNCPRLVGSPSKIEGGECCGVGLQRAFYKAIPTMSECCSEKDSDGNVISEEVRAIGTCV